MTTTDHAPCTIRPVIERYVASAYHVRDHPTRLAVVRGAGGGSGWVVWLGHQYIAALPTHAEAIAYADRMARVGK